jgi:hypothetical protein
MALLLNLIHSHKEGRDAYTKVLKSTIMRSSGVIDGSQYELSVQAFMLAQPTRFRFPYCESFSMSSPHITMPTD